jgi:hypothetical protein
MPLTFENLTEAEQLVYANALETWARAVRDAQRWKRERTGDAATADPPLSAATLEELTARLADGYAARIPAQPTPDQARTEELEG